MTNPSGSQFLDIFVSDLMTKVVLWITNLGDIPVVLLVTVGVIVALYQKRHYAYAHILAGGVALSSILVVLLKNIFRFARPVEGIIIEGGYSFPSGHATLAMTLYGTLIYIIGKYPTTKTFKTVSITILSILIILIPITRLYLGVHYGVDVIAGMCLGLLSIMCMIEVSRSSKRLHHKFMKSK